MRKLCKGCGKYPVRDHRARCEVCSRSSFLVTKYGSGKYFADLEFARAKNKGLFKISKKTKCVDCGFPASGNDHRDYNYPLTVEPVCHSCNRRRGSARIKDWSFDEFVSWLNDNGRYHFRFKVTEELLNCTEKEFNRRRHMKIAITAFDAITDGKLTAVKK